MLEKGTITEEEYNQWRYHYSEYDKSQILAKIADDKAIPIYNKYYKRYAARLKVRQIKEADFKKWKYQAMAKRDECSAGTITPEEYTEWMEAAFPNRTPKSGTNMKHDEGK